MKKQKYNGGGLSSKYNSLKLQKFKETNTKRKVIVTIIILSILLLSGIYLYNTFAVFTEEKHFNVIKGTVSDPGDIYFAYYVNNTITRSMPKKGTGYTLDTEKSTCTNGVVPTWDDDTYSAILNFEGYNATDYTRTRCELYFKTQEINATEKITTLAKTDTVNLVYDNTIDNNLRYIGADPNNYVDVGDWFDKSYYNGSNIYDRGSCDYGTCEILHESKKNLWRIIGVMNNIDDGTGKKESRIKLISDDSIFPASYDFGLNKTKQNTYGVNEWSESDIMQLLNPGYNNNSINGSMYYYGRFFGWEKLCNLNGKHTANCYTGLVSFPSILDTLSANAVWNTGANNNNAYTNKFYEYERSSNTGKICSSGDYCNDEITRKTTWTGKVGLMYPSDYGYATSGGSTTDRTTCLNTMITSWATEGDCAKNDWLNNNGNPQWTITPQANNQSAFMGTPVPANAMLMSRYSSVATSYHIKPVVYLKSNVKIVSGTGTQEDPFILGEGE